MWGALKILATEAIFCQGKAKNSQSRDLNKNFLTQIWQKIALSLRVELKIATVFLTKLVNNPAIHCVLFIASGNFERQRKHF